MEGQLKHQVLVKTLMLKLGWNLRPGEMQSTSYSSMGFWLVLNQQSPTLSELPTKKNNEVTKVELKCNKHGKTKKADQQEQDNCIEHQGCEKGPKRNTNVQVKTDCRVVMVIKEHQQKWVIDRLDLEHNHDLRPADNNNMFSGHKYMTEMEKGVIRTLNHNNIPTRKMIAILSYLRGGMTTLSYKKKRCK